jgi:hypothetical protein
MLSNHAGVSLSHSESPNAARKGHACRIRAMSCTATFNLF